MSIDLSQFVNQTVKVKYRDGAVRTGIIKHNPSKSILDRESGRFYVFNVINAPANSYCRSGRYLNDAAASSLDIVKIELIQNNLSDRIAPFVMTLSKEQIQSFIDLYFNEIECDDGDKIWQEFSGRLEDFQKFADSMYRIGYKHALYKAAQETQALDD